MENPRNHGRRAAIRNSLRTSLAAAAAMTLSAATARAQGRRGAAMRAPLPNAADERRVLAVIEDVYRNHRYLSVPQEDGRLLRLLAESTGARHVVELGTSTGYSGLWLLLALSRTGGRLTTFEADRDRHRMARSNFDRAGLLPLATVVLGDAHVEAAKLKDPIDLLFLDADKEGYLDYLTKLRPLLRPGGLIVAHNMARPSPDSAYLNAVTTDPGLETAFVNMQAAGIGITLKKR